MEIIVIELGFDDHITAETQSHRLPYFMKSYRPFRLLTQTNVPNV